MNQLTKITKRTLSLFLCACLLLSQTGCSTDEVLDGQGGANESITEQTSGINAASRTVDLMADVVSGKSLESQTENSSISSDFLTSCLDFSVRLFQQNSTDDKISSNIMISPLSVLTALSMTVNGAAGDTQKEILKTVFGHLSDTMTMEEINQNMNALFSSLPSGEEAKLLQANSIWFLEDESAFNVNPDFLQTNADYYQTDAFRAPFNDQTLADINQWVSDHTDRMIPSILDQIPPDAVMYLINALAFDAVWDSPYHEYQIREGEFTNEDKSISQVSMMSSEENQYLQMEHAEGFIKPYKEGYSFVALLPEEGMSIEEFVNTLSGDALYKVLSEPASEMVQTLLPKFTAEYDTELSATLNHMGMELPFDSSKADFSRLGSCPNGDNIFISRILHKTFISVDEKGTRAGASTAVEMLAEGCTINPHCVELNRPFIYMIIDQSTCMPVFMGAVNHLPETEK